MHQPRFPDKYDWHGCEAVQCNPLKLGGRAAVGGTRMDADGGLSGDEIVDSFGVDRATVEAIHSRQPA